RPRRRIVDQASEFRFYAEDTSFHWNLAEEAAEGDFQAWKELAGQDRVAAELAGYLVAVFAEHERESRAPLRVQDPVQFLRPTVNQLAPLVQASLCELLEGKQFRHKLAAPRIRPTSGSS